jgi:endonuclease YncB( thermonuclease family)
MIRPAPDRLFHATLALVVVAMLLGMGQPAPLPVGVPAPPPQPPPPGTYTWDVPERGWKTVYVLDCHDGDTCSVALLVPLVCRLDGVNAPELKAAGGPASRDALKTLVKGKLLTAELRGREKYGRTLMRLWLPGPPPVDVSAWMVANSFAVPYDGGPR